jgi:YVTN family beta-propeller protein
VECKPAEGIWQKGEAPWQIKGKLAKSEPVGAILVVSVMRRTLFPFALAVASLARADTPDRPVDKTAPARLDDAWTNERLDTDKTLLVTGQKFAPEGKFLKLPGRVLAVEFARGGKVLVVKTSSYLVSVNPDTMTVIAKVAYPDKSGAGMHGLAVSSDGTKVYVSGGSKNLMVADVAEDGALAIARSIDLSDKGKSVAPLGLVLTPDGRKAFVALSLSNELACVDLASGKVISRTPVGVCPYGVAISRDGKTAFVSNFGGNRPESGEATENSGGSAVAVDARSIPLRGTVSVVTLDSTPRASESVRVGLHPGELLLSRDGSRLFVANVGGDSVSILDTASRKVVRTLDMKASPELPFGTLCDGLALSDDGRTLHVANAGINAVSTVSLDEEKPLPKLTPAGWYPGAVRVRDGAMFVGCVLGGVQKVVLSSDAKEVATRDARARESARLIQAGRASLRASSTDVPPVPVPAKVGEPSVIRHVVYVIKENRTYDQVLGDIGKGNGDPKLCNFPRKITPNHHALAEQFVLLDNYYCNGVLSSDGHAWSVQGMTTPYREKDFSGYRCAYDFGTDALCYASCGFIWDHALMNGRSFRNYGELDFTVKVRGKTYDDFFTDWKNKTGKTAFRCEYKLDALRRYSCPDFPGWEMSIPDQVRADAFLRELKQFEKTGNFPDITIVYLPNDHTAKELTPNSYVADNDLALGRVVEGISKSRFWKDTVIFVNEDDPQAGHDHVDGHRSFCLVIGPWVKRGAIVSKFYNQSSVLHTLCRIAGLPPLNQMVAASTTMEDCFAKTPDMTPYKALIPDSPLNEKRPSVKTASDWTPGIFLSAEERLERRFAKLDFSVPDVIDEDVLNRAIWAQTRPGEAYPAAFAGAHGKGLAALGLSLNPEVDDDDD